jgi:hypothetical protein
MTVRILLQKKKYFGHKPEEAWRQDMWLAVNLQWQSDSDSDSDKRLVAGFPLRLPEFDPTSSHVGFMVDEIALEQVCFEYFCFPCQCSFHQMLHTHLSSADGTIGQLVADVPSGLSFTPPHGKKIGHKAFSRHFRSSVVVFL